MSSFKFLKPLCVLVLFIVPGNAQSDFSHPLDPLNGDEIAVVAATLKAENKTTEGSRLWPLVLRDPPKAEVLNFKPGAPFRREAFVVVFERAANKTFEAVVDVKARKVLSWKEIKAVQPTTMTEDFMLATSIVNNDPNWRAALKKRGIADYQNVQVDPWSAGWLGFKDETNIRMARGIPFYRGTARNAYPHPIEGLVAYIDLTHKKILRIVDTGVAPVPGTSAELDPESGYLLLTGENSISFSGVNSFVRKRAGFVNHHLWVTPHVPEEMNAAGFYINQGKGGDGLPRWTRGNRAIENQDVVLWYSMGITHIPRSEDWPVMPVHKTGFKLIPNGFFARNPSMDVPK